MTPEELRQAAEDWLAVDPDEQHRGEIRTMLAQDDLQALESCFPARLRFGTAGIRAPLGVGPGRMNRVGVRRCVAALCQHLLRTYGSGKPLEVCVGFDGRHLSRVFAADAAVVAGAAGLKVRAFQAPVPTPLLAFATRHHGAAAGVMITASHNPPGDNGIKVYWRGGSQILPPHDAAIEKLMLERGLRDAHLPSEPHAPPTPVEWIDESMERIYLEAVAAVLPPVGEGNAPSVSYSALYGVGAPLTRKLLDERGVSVVHEVTDQCEIDPDFGGLSSPNPESPEAVERGYGEAVAQGSDLLLLHDPDADRLAVGVRHAGGLQMLNGNEIGCLLGHALLADRGHTKPVVVTSVVSSELLASIARDLGAECLTTPTGFKWITAAGRHAEQTESATYVFGYEEALGFCLGELGDDKDGIAPLGLIVELARQLAAQQQTLIDRLHALYAEYGVHRSSQVSWRWERAASADAIARLMARVRSEPPKSLASHALSQQVDHALASPAAELVELRYGRALRVLLRPSGTEPKLKAYIEARVAIVDGQPVEGALTAADTILGEAAEELRDALA